MRENWDVLDKILKKVILRFSCLFVGINLQ